MLSAHSDLVNIRLYRIGGCVQVLFNLARLLSNLLQRARIVRSIIPARPSSKSILRAQIIACGPSDLRHDYVLILLIHAMEESVR